MQMSQQGLIALACHEGLALGPYKDSVGVWTSGIGHTAAAGGIDPQSLKTQDTTLLDKSQIEPLIKAAFCQFRTDLARYEKRVNMTIQAPLKKHQFDALVSFDFNTGGISRAKLSKEINSGDYSGAGFLGWMRPKEIGNRRHAEKALFCNGNYPSDQKLAIYDVLENGTLRYRSALKSSEIATFLKPSKGFEFSKLLTVLKLIIKILGKVRK